MFNVGELVTCHDFTNHAHFLFPDHVYRVLQVRKNDGWLSLEDTTPLPGYPARMARMWEPLRFTLYTEVRDYRVVNKR